MSEKAKQNSSVISIDEDKIKKVLTGKLNEENTTAGLTNEHNEPLEDLIHPLIHSIDNKNHPKMQAVPAAVKFTRDYKALYDELRKE